VPKSRIYALTRALAIDRKADAEGDSALSR
jgi:hypothetical protein